MLIYAIKSFALFAILIGNCCEFGLAREIKASANDILELAECYKQFKYGQNIDAEENKQLGLEINPKNTEQMRKIMEKHFGIILFFQKCLNKEQKNKKAFGGFQKELFEKSKMDAWLEFMIPLKFQKIFVKSKMSEWLKFVLPFLKDEYNKIGEEENKTFKVWRRMLIPHGLLVEAFYFGFTKNLLDKTMAKFPPKISEQNPKLVENLKWISKRMGEEAETNMSIAALSFLRQFLKEKSIGNFIMIFKKMENLIRNLEIEWNLNESELLESKKYNLPKVKRVIWIFRHAHRLDNGLNDEKDEKKMELENKKKWAKMLGEELVDEDEELKKEKEEEFKRKKEEEKLKKEDEKKKEEKKTGMNPDLLKPFKVNGRIFGRDNSPLSEKGKEMAAKMEPILAIIPVKHIYASPFERTVETAGLLLGKKNHPGVKIRLEPGLLESMHKSKREPTFLDCEELEKAGHDRLDCEYEPKYGKKELMERAKKVEIGDRDDACVIRAEEILAKILKSENDEGTSHSYIRVATKVKNEDDKASHFRHEHHQGEVVDHFKLKGTEKEEDKEKWGKRKEWIAPGEENAEHIVLVSHATMILATEQYFEGKYKYVPQLSITKLVELKDNGKENEKENPLKNIRMVYGSESKHLADESGLQMHLYKH